VVAFVAVCLLGAAAAGLWSTGWAQAGSHDENATSFGLKNQSVEVSHTVEVSPETVQDKSTTTELAVEDVTTTSTLQSAATRDVSEGVQEIATEEEAARKAAEEAAKAAEETAINRANEKRSRYYAMYGSLPAGDVDFSIGRDAFIKEWTTRINNYLAGSPLAGYGETFATAAWENGIDPRWSPAISNTESTKGRNCFKSHNAWGWSQTDWPDWGTAINAHVSGLAKGYGFTISYSYAMRYCPPNYDNWYRDTLNEMMKI
jgi:hypothetical protein